MKIPANVPTLEMANATLWKDERGIVYSTPKSDSAVEQTVEQIRADMDRFREFTGGQKVCLIIESNSSSRPPKKEERDFIAQQIDSITRAMAIVTTSPLSRMVANLFFGLKPPPYPAKMFNNEKEALEWILQYVEQPEQVKIS